MKQCRRCGQEKPTSEFYRRGDGQGCRSACIACYKRTAEQKRRRRERRAARPERAIRNGMIQRCCNPQNPSYRDYGERGIGVCARWLESFENFLADMGHRPSPRHSIDRVDNDGDYCPENCRWATRVEQNRNTRQNVVLTVGGISKTRTEWAEQVGVSPRLIRDRMNKLGWDTERAMSEPVHPQRRSA